MAHHIWRPASVSRPLAAVLGLVALAAASIGPSAVHGATAQSLSTVAFTRPAALTGSALTLRTLSARADRVSGGNVLVEIDGTPSSPPPQVRLNGTDVSAVFKAGSTPGSLTGLVAGLKNGPNLLTARDGGGPPATLILTNYPITGPITSGPHIAPFLCQTSTFQIPEGAGGQSSTFGGTPVPYGAPLDADCSRPTNITYLYMPTGGPKFLTLPSTTKLPADVASTTTTTGRTVPFVVRVETSTIDRGIYQSAVLDDPTKAGTPSPTAPPPAWNGGLIAVEGYGCPGGWYTQGASEGSLQLPNLDFSLLSPTRLGEGSALFTNTLMHASNDCNSVLSGESASMSKEHFIETYGVPKYTVSEGCSGGSYGSIQLADAEPGLYDGVLIACTFPDPLAIALSGSDGRLLYHYFSTHPGIFTPAQQVAISGYKSMSAFTDAADQSGRTDPIIGRKDSLGAGYVAGPCPPGLPAAQIYDPKTNPKGVRCDVYDAARNIYGTDPATSSALRPFDNTGVLYGLKAFQAGTITPTQFLDLNTGIGGFDRDANYTSKRSVGDLGAIRRAFQGGLEFSGSAGAGAIPVMDLTGIYNDDAGYHYQWTHFATRARIASANGNAANEVMWRGNAPFTKAWSTFIGWVQAVAADQASGAQRAKVIADKPAAAVDGCWTATTTFVAEPQTFGTTGSTCNTAFPSYAFPRYVAGGPVAADILKCQPKPVRSSDYPASLTAADLTRLRAAFPAGVCDWSKPGLGNTRVVPWASFGPAPVGFIPVPGTR